MNKENRVTSAYGFTVGFDGKSQFAPIAVQRFYNIDLDKVEITCYGEVAELALKRPERVTISCKDCSYKVAHISRNIRDNSVVILLTKN